ncbi:sigma-54-dependent Fis family transcriptional regulator [Achromobacter sp. SD115]|uniref:sigma 54-interacting transcriptional regulator n=1 Tax=Achromobacter sp. SD115 TaxID=2782011 RepID=UPI001A96DEC6|nr:sigma-54 dependent transcriptional regulator [Achromobacter sp. SD115]MBO1014757.1 sigma-54-dependent Fis family transcriptional regulator [Achromobacter sp. SD115]
MSQNFAREEFDVYVWEGTSDIASRAERCLAGMDVSLLRADAGTAFPPPRDLARPAVALVSVSVMGDKRFSGYDWLAAQGLPVIWVAAEARGRDPRYYPPEYSYTLPLTFTTADLRKLLYELLGTLNQLTRSAPRREQPLVAVSATMQDLLAEAEMYADCRSNVLIHGETGVGKERIARLLHDHAAWSGGPFVAVNCGAIPEGLFEAHFFGHAKGAFTGAIGAHKGYFEQASGGTLFLDEIGDLPLYQQVKLLRVLEQSTVTRLGSTVEVPVDFRLVAATNKDLRVLVGQDEFRADLYYRLAVIELRIPNLEQRGPEEKAAIFRALLQGQGVDGEPPQWLLDRVSRTRYEGNVRELSNVAERVAIVRRQFQAWDLPRIERIFDQLAEPLRVVGAAAGARAEPAVFTDAERAERERVLAALDANGWRRQDTAHTLGISRKVLWEKMRKLQLGAGQGEPADGVAETV